MRLSRRFNRRLYMEDIIKFLRAKAAVYEVLAVPYYKEADKDFTDKLHSMMPVFEAFIKAGENDRLTEGVNLLKNFLNGTESVDYESLASEFARLFLIKNINQGIEGIVPCESAYLSPGGLIMQDERDMVLEAYYDSGLRKSDSFKETEDHISAELAFLARLNNSAALALEEGRRGDAEKLAGKAADFISSHLMKWLPAAAGDIASMTTSGYFRAVALITLGMAETDAEYAGV